jgi:hypothetical protein
VNRPEDQRKRRDRRPLGLVALIGGTIAAACLIGFGGLAAWTVTTQNAGNAFAAGSVHHTNLAKLNGAGVGTSCTDQAGVCGVIFTLANAKPGSSVSGTVQITNNAGSLPSTFSLSLSSSSGALCASLNASITDNETTPQNFYNGTLSAMGAQSLKSSAGNASWPASDTGTYTFTITLPASSANTDMGQTCTAAYTWTQTNS